MLNNLITLLIIATIVRSIYNFALLYNNTQWLLTSKDKSEIVEYPFVSICIPVLREQSVILETIEHFLKFNYPKDKFKLYIITTEKEDIDRQKHKKSCQTTKELIESNLFRYDNTKIIHYPNDNTTATEQINYGLSEIYNESGKSDWVAIYNADSRPNLDTLTLVVQKSIEFEDKHKTKANIIQQSSLFSLNCNSFSNSPKDFLAFAGGIWQTKFTLTHELFLFRTQSCQSIKPKNNFVQEIWNSQTSYCVGHGMFIRLEYFKSRNFYPTETLNEDLPFGFYTTILGEPIIPLEILENSETPASIKSLINQKTVWFSPYLQYLECRKKCIKDNPKVNRVILNTITVKALSLGLLWFFRSFALVLPLVYSIAMQNLNLFIFWYTSLSLYWLLPSLYILLNLKNLEQNSGKIVTKLTFLDYLGVLFFGQLNALLDSVGPILCVTKFIWAIINKQVVTKPKTER